MIFNSGCEDEFADRLLEGLPKSERRVLTKLKPVALEEGIPFVSVVIADDDSLKVVIDQAIKKSCQEAGVRLLWGGQDLACGSKDRWAV